MISDRKILKHICALSALFLTVCFIVSAIPQTLGAHAWSGASYYLICKENDFEKTDTSYALSIDAAVTDYTEFACDLPFEAEEGESFSYYIYEPVSNKKYFPSATGVVKFDESGDYTVRFSLDPIFADGKEYYTYIDYVEPPAAETEYEYYVFCAQNQFEKDAAYKLEVNVEQTGYIEYEYRFSIAEETSFSYFIFEDTVKGTRPAGRQEKFYPNSTSVAELSPSGNYVVKFSLSHTYFSEGGRNYNTAVERVPEAHEIVKYYLYSIDSNFESDDNYLLTLNTANTSFYEYTYSLTTSKSVSYSYFIYDEENDARYYPNDKGIVEMKEAGEYIIKFSPAHAYSTFEGKDYFTTAEFMDDAAELDYFLMFKGNDFTQNDDYKLSLNADNELFKEYIYVFSIAAEQDFAYYIYEPTAGEKYYPSESGVLHLKETGEYAVKFSLEHIYNTTDNTNFYTIVETYAPIVVTAKYYLMSKDSDFEINESFLLSLNSKNSAFHEYVFTFNVSDAISYSYYILESFTHTKYYPNAQGYVELEESGDYTVKFSLSHAYSTEGSGSSQIKYYTGIEINEYDGFYFMSNLNDYRYTPSDEKFVELYKFTSDSSKAGYTHKLTIDITNKILDKYDGLIDFYISDGANRYMAPGEEHFEIKDAGSYDIFFAEPDNNESNASVYSYLTKSYLPSNPVTELECLDKNNNYVYIEGENLTGDMVVSVVERGKYKFIEIKQDGKIIKYGTIKITYYMEGDPKDYEVYYYQNKLEEKAESEILGRNIVFSLNEGTGFVIIQKEQPISLLNAIVIAATAGIVVIIASVIISYIVKRTKRKKDDAPENGSN